MIRRLDLKEGVRSSKIPNPKSRFENQANVDRLTEQKSANPKARLTLALRKWHAISEKKFNAKNTAPNIELGWMITLFACWKNRRNGIYYLLHGVPFEGKSETAFNANWGERKWVPIASATGIVLPGCCATHSPIVHTMEQTNSQTRNQKDRLPKCE